MEMTRMEGENRGKVILYALSTCVWCKKTKRLLGHLGVEYSYIDVDLLDKEDKDKVLDEIRKHNPACTFPTIVINEGERCIRGYKADEIKEALEK